MSRKWRGGPGRPRRPSIGADLRGRAAPYAAAIPARPCSMMPSASSISRSPTISGGRMRSTLSPAVRHSSPSAAQLGDEIAGRHDCSGCRAAGPSRAIRRTASDRPRPALRAAPQQLAPSRSTRVEEAGLQHHVEHGVAGRHRQRVAAEGRAVACPATMPTAAFSVARQAPIGKPFPSALATAMMSGGDPVPFMREQLAGAAHAALHLVIDEQQPELVADRRADPCR